MDEDYTQPHTTAQDLTAGTYNVTVTDNNGWTAIDSVTLTETLLLVVSITGSTNVSCFGADDGEVISSASGGTLPYTFVWDDDDLQITPTATGLDGGTYTVILVDSLGCDTTATETITEPALLVAPITAVTNVGCKDDSTGSATVSASGGNPPYTYAWTTLPVQTGSVATGLPAGTYSVTVTDSLGCDTTESVTITEPDYLVAALSGVNVSCKDFNDGEATVVATGGTIPYTYSWNTTPVQTTDTATGLIAGTYILTLTDFYGCDTTANITITEPDTLMASISSTNVSCFGNGDGEATVTASGGTSSYTYSWNTTPIQTTAIATGLVPATYTVIVTDNQGCDTTADVTITEPDTFITTITGINDVTCNGFDDGEATAAVTGGTPGYAYSWNSVPSQFTATATGLGPGTYINMVVDTNGCVTTDTVVITQPDVLTASI